MPTNTLTDARCKGAKPADKPYKLFDGGGLFLYVSPTGAKVWRIAYRVEGKPQTKSFGAYPAVSLAEARAQREALKADLRAGIDPAADNRARRAARRAGGVTLSAATERYWEGRRDVSDGYRQNAQRGIERHLFPKLGERPIGEITRDDLLEELRHMDASGRHVYVRKVRMWVSQVFDWAIENGYATTNPAAAIRPERAFTQTKTEHFPALSLNEIPALLQRLSMENRTSGVLVCRMLALTWTRTNEMRMMRWSEIDLKESRWLIPAGKMKRRRDHVVPLSRQALALLDEMRARSRGSGYVFPAEHRDDRPLSENAVLSVLARIGYKGRMTGHGWRTVASTWANERGYSPDAIERQLAHVPENRVRSAYNRAEYMPERSRMLQSWADWLDEAEAEAEGITSG